MQEIADELKLPESIKDAVGLLLETDVGRRGVSDDFFMTTAGEYYGIAKILQVADSIVHPAVGCWHDNSLR